MNNLFDSANYPQSEPDELVVGARWAWTRPDITNAYPTSAYTLKYRFNLMVSNGAVKTFTAAKTGGAHVVEVAAATTAAYTAGDYSWQAVVVRDSDSEEVTVDSGFSVFVPKLSGSTADTRSHAYITMKAIEAVIQGVATKEQQSYSIAGRSLTRYSHKELVDFYERYKRMWKAEMEAKRRKSGRKTGSRVLVKMRA